MTEGLMSLLDIIGRNVLHHLNPQVYLVSSLAYMINYNISGKFIESIIYITGALLFPIALGSFISAGLGLPLFMYTSVLEKQTRVKSIMKMHGLKEYHYWLVSILNNFLLYCAIYFTFYFSGYFVFEMKIFTETSQLVMVGQVDAAYSEPHLGTEPGRPGHHPADLRGQLQDGEHSRLHLRGHGAVRLSVHEPPVLPDPLRGAH